MKVAVTSILNPSGIHARPAAAFITEAKKYTSKITIINLKTQKSADAKSMLKVLTLGLVKGTQIQLSAQGEDEEDAVAALLRLIESGLGEV